jgi:ribonuclease HII
MNFQEITQYERKLYNDGIKYVAGIDEVGRGPLAGPFVVSAVILDLGKIFSKELELMINDTKEGKKPSEQSEQFLYTKINDSKQVSPKNRELLAEFIRKNAVSYSIKLLSPEKLDEIGISAATQLCFFNAIKNLKTLPEVILTDTFEVKKIIKDCQINITRGDTKSISIAAASIVAKVYRDNIMVEMHEKYPLYGFDRHKGYGTKYHIEALYKYGPCEIHRRSFSPVKEMVGKK